ncbi:MAG TPA: hypothetical protein VFU02_16045 [Polyangiaceae bacterium]|nr:hypothetical protein [Polyangiaceae bacterium]
MLRFERGLLFLGLGLGAREKHRCDHATDDQKPRHDADGNFELFLALIALNGGDLSFVLLLGSHRLEPRMMLGFGSGFLDFCLSDGFEPRRLFPASLLFVATSFLFFSEPALFGRPRGAFGSFSGLAFCASFGFFLCLFFLDPVFLKVHQLFEREKNRAFFLFGHLW